MRRVQIVAVFIDLSLGLYLSPANADQPDNERKAAIDLNACVLSKAFVYASQQGSPLELGYLAYVGCADEAKKVKGFFESQSGAAIAERTMQMIGRQLSEDAASRIVQERARLAPHSESK